MKQYDFGADFLHPELKRFVFGYHVELQAPTAVEQAPTAVEAVAAAEAAN